MYFYPNLVGTLVRTPRPDRALAGADGATTPPCAVTAVVARGDGSRRRGSRVGDSRPNGGRWSGTRAPRRAGGGHRPSSLRPTSHGASSSAGRPGGVSATGVAVAAVRREEERRGAGFAGGAEVPAGSGRRGAAHGHAAGSTLAFPTTTGLQRASRLPADSAVVLARRPRRAFRRRAWTADWRGGGVGTWPATAGTHLARVDARRRRGRAARCATERRPRWVAAPSSPAPRRCPPRPERIYWVAGRAVSTC